MFIQETITALEKVECWMDIKKSIICVVFNSLAKVIQTTSQNGQILHNFCKYFNDKNMDINLNCSLSI